MLAPLMSAKLMEHGDWLPLLLALAFQQMAVFIALGFPETLHLRDLPEPVDAEDVSIQLEQKHKGHGLKAQLSHFKDALTFLKRDWLLALVIFTFFGNRLGRQALSLLLRYASKRYNWKLKKVSLGF